MAGLWVVCGLCLSLIRGDRRVHRSSPVPLILLVPFSFLTRLRILAEVLSPRILVGGVPPRRATLRAPDPLSSRTARPGCGGGPRHIDRLARSFPGGGSGHSGRPSVVHRRGAYGARESRTPCAGPAHPPVGKHRSVHGAVAFPVDGACIRSVHRPVADRAPPPLAHSSPVIVCEPPAGAPPSCRISERPPCPRIIMKPETPCPRARIIVVAIPWTVIISRAVNDRPPVHVRSGVSRGISDIDDVGRVAVYTDVPCVIHGVPGGNRVYGRRDRIADRPGTGGGRSYKPDAPVAIVEQSPHANHRRRCVDRISHIRILNRFKLRLAVILDLACCLSPVNSGRLGDLRIEDRLLRGDGPGDAGENVIPFRSGGNPGEIPGQPVRGDEGPRSVQ